MTSASGTHRNNVGTSNSGSTFRDVLRLLASAQKKAAPGSPPYSIYVNRPVGRYAAAAAFRAGLSPNGISSISFAFTMTGIVLLAVAPARGWVGLAVWLTLAFGYVLDSADGQVARLRGGGSLAGEWLDHVLDSIKIPCLHMAVLITFYRHFELPNQAWLLVPVGYAIVACVSFFAMILNDQLKTRYVLQSGSSSSVTSKSRRSPIKSIMLVPTDYGILCLLFLSLGFHSLFLVLYSAFFAANAAYLTLASRKWFVDFRRLAVASTAVSNKEP